MKITRLSPVLAALILALVPSLPAGLRAQTTVAGAPTGNSLTASDRAVLADFDRWSDGHRRARATVAATGQTERAADEGVALARRRREILARLLPRDPAAVLAAAVPAADRRGLPAEVQAELEVPVSGTGDYLVYGALAAKDGPAVTRVRREVELNGVTYPAFVYGRRAGQTTKFGIPLHGVLVDGVLALHEDALEPLAPGEADGVAAVVSLAQAGDADPASGDVLARVGGVVYRFASAKALARAQVALAQAESGLDPRSARPVAEVLGASSSSAPARGGDATLPTAESAYTEGNKKVLVIRVDFSDLPGNPTYGGTTYTAPVAQNLIDTSVASFFASSSYGISTLTSTVSPQLYRMPQTAAAYAQGNLNSQLHSDARAAAAANYTLANYDRIAVLFTFLGNLPNSQIDYGGLAQVGGPNMWVNGEWDFRVVSHELGHTYGLFHANLWQVNDGNPASLSGTTDEYEDDFDTMGANFANDTRTDFNPWFKNRLNWIPDARVQTVTTSGTYRVTRVDGASNNATLALKITKDATRNYWVTCRRKFTDNPSLQNGAYIIWGYNSNDESNLLDMTTPGTNSADAALAVNSTFTDAAANVSIRPVSNGGDFMDIQVTIGTPPPVNRPPNDAFANSQLISGNTGNVVGTNVNATRETGEPNHGGETGSASIWYAWTAPSAGAVTFNTNGSNYDTLLGVYTGTAVNALTFVAGNDDFSGVQSQVTFNVTGGQVYRVAVDGFGSGTGNVSLNWGFTPSVVAPKDFNGDNKNDILWQNSSTGERSVWLMNNTAFSSGIALGNVPTAWSMAAAADFSGDNRPDILWENLSTGERSIWIMNGTAYSSGASLGNVPTAWRMAGAADFNADNKRDIVWQNVSTGQRSVWLMNNTAFSSGVALPNVPTEWLIMGAADFNADGRPDLLWHNQTTGDVSIWLMNGTAYSSGVSVARVPAPWQIGGTADFNGDGKPDILWQNLSTGERSIWLMNNTAFSSGVALPNVPTVWRMRDY